MKELIKPQKQEKQYLNAEAYCETFNMETRDCSGMYCADHTLGTEACGGMTGDSEDSDILF